MEGRNGTLLAMKESEFQEKVDRLQAKLHAVQAERDQLQADNQRLKMRVENLFNQNSGEEYIPSKWLLPKWKYWAMVFMVIIGLLGLLRSVQGYEKTSDWAKQNSPETCASHRGNNWLEALLPDLEFLEEAFGPRNSRAQRRIFRRKKAVGPPICADATLINRAFLGIFSITLLGGALIIFHESLIIYQRRRMEVLEALLDDSEATDDIKPKVK
jgi:hypothetical protein